MSEPIRKEATGRYVVVLDVAPGEKRRQGTSEGRGRPERAMRRQGEGLAVGRLH